MHLACSYYGVLQNEIEEIHIFSTQLLWYLAKCNGNEAK